MVSLTDSAITQIHYLINLRKNKPIGMRVIISKKGCSGISYDMDYVNDQSDTDHTIPYDKFSLFIKKAHLFFVMNTTIDYEDDLFKPGFVFLNDKMKGKCDCGESFIF